MEFRLQNNITIRRYAGEFQLRSLKIRRRTQRRTRYPQPHQKKSGSKAACTITASKPSPVSHPNRFVTIIQRRKFFFIQRDSKLFWREESGADGTDLFRPPMSLIRAGAPVCLKGLKMNDGNSLYPSLPCTWALPRSRLCGKTNSRLTQSRFAVRRAVW